MLASQHVIGQKTHRVHVGARIHRRAAQLFGRHCRGRPHHGARVGEPWPFLVEELGEAKVEQDRAQTLAVLCQDHVTGLDVAVDDAGRMRLVEGLPKWGEDRNHVSGWPAAPLDLVLEGRAAQKFQNQVGPTICEDPMSIGLDDVAMGDPRDGFLFALESAEGVRRSNQFSVEDFYRNFAVRAVRAPNRAKPTTTQLFPKGVSSYCELRH
jgi:hypothetical protein